MHVLVPFDAQNPKTRLSPILDDADRDRFARLMLDTVIDVLHRADCEPTVLATAPIDLESPLRVDDRDLSVAVNAAVEDTGLPVGIVMADLPLLTVGTVERLLRADGDVVIAPGLGGGTNALVIRDTAFSVDYHGASFRDHYRHAREHDLDVTVLDSFRLAVDVDEESELIEVLLHGDDTVREWLLARDITLDVDGEQPTLSLPGENR